MKQADYYMVQVNMGTADHPIVPLYKEGDAYISDDVFDVYETAKDVHRGFCETEGRVCYYSDSLERAEDILIGVYMVRRLLRRWVDA